MIIRSWKRALLLHLIGLSVAPVGGHAQTATLLGLVMRDSAGHELGGADVKISGLAQHVLTNQRGAFRIDALPAGRYVLTIRHLGFKPSTDTIEVAAGQRLERQFVL